MTESDRYGHIFNISGMTATNQTISVFTNFDSRTWTLTREP